MGGGHGRRSQCRGLEGTVGTVSRLRGHGLLLGGRRAWVSGHWKQGLGGRAYRRSMQAGRRSGAVARGRAVGCGSRRSHGAVAEVKRWRRSHGGGGCAVVEVALWWRSHGGGGRAIVEVARRRSWWSRCRAKSRQQIW